MTGVRIGVDVGGTKAAGVALDADLRVVATAQRSTRRGPDGVVATVRALVSELTAVWARDAQPAVARSVGAGTRRTTREALDDGAPAEGRVDPDPPSLSVVSLGVGIPGIVANGVVRHAVNLDVRQLDLAAVLRAELGVPVGVDNDVRAAALGAHAAFGGTLAYLNLGTGIAAGLVMDGRVRRGSTGAAGEIGHVSIDPAGPVCACGQRGCIEAFAGGAAIARRWATGSPELVGAFADRAVVSGEIAGAPGADPSGADRARSGAPGRNPDDAGAGAGAPTADLLPAGLAGAGSAISDTDRSSAPRDILGTPLAADAERPAAHAVFDAADRGDARATRIRDDAVRAIAAAAQILVLTADVDRIVLGGGVARLGDRLRHLVARDLDRAAAASPFLTELRIADRIEIDPPGSNAPAIGAALLTG